MKFTIAFVAAFAAYSQASDPPGVRAVTACSKPVANTCTFYSKCLEPVVHCNATGWPIDYAAKACETFTSTKVSDELSKGGKAWVTASQLCVQKEMVPYALREKKTTCTNLKDIALDSINPACYVNNGMCNLPESDWNVIFNAFDWRKLYTNEPDFVKPMESMTGDECDDLWTWFIDRFVYNETMPAV